MDNFDLLSSQESFIEESGDILIESSDIDQFQESSSDESLIETGQDGSDASSIEYEAISLILTDIYSETVELHKCVDTTNSLLICLIFFTVTQWVVSKIKGAVERMLNWRI